MTLYEKVGRRYRPVREEAEWDTLPAGHYLIAVVPGQRSCTSVVKPDYAAVLAACRAGERELVQAVVNAMKARPRVLSAKERRAVRAYNEIMGGESCLTLDIPAAQAAFNAFVAAICEKAREN